MVKIETLKVNQIIVHDGETSTLFSYDTPIVSKTPTGIVLHKAWNYSATTGKYRNIFLRENLGTTRDKLMKGIYTLRVLSDKNK